MIVCLVFLCAVLFGMGDVIAQVVVSEKDEKFDYRRVCRAWIFGTFILGPLAHAHFEFLEWFVVRRVNNYMNICMNVHGSVMKSVEP